ncbi:MAG TPA: TRAP transporter small permease [Geminicoccaceae bacterium]|nr:TRAP transporter small permease [Geminicoccaceae bacterium]
MGLAKRLDRLSTLIERIAGLFLAAITVLVFASAIGRYAFAAPIPDAFDVSRLMLGVAVLWGFASVGYRGAHIKVDLVAEVVPPRLCFWLDVIASVVLLLFTAVLAWMLLGRVESAYASNEATFDLRLAVWPWLAAIWLGVLASVFTITSRIVLMLLGFAPVARSTSATGPQ